MPILILLLIVPIAEIAVFIQVGERIGVLWTVALVILTAVIGTALLRAQGFAVLAQARVSLERGTFPVREAFDGLCVLAAGMLLLTPGFITDTIGVILFIPAVRARLRAVVLAWLLRHGRISVRTAGAGGAAPGPRGGPYRGPDGAPTIEGEFTDLTEPGGDRDKGGKDEGDGGTEKERRRLRDARGRRSPWRRPDEDGR